jgi:hypothetical protein
MSNAVAQSKPAAVAHDAPVPSAPAPSDRPEERAPGMREVGGRNGPEPTRFGDWEKNGRCIDF